MTSPRQKEYSIVASDLDGTLLGPDHKLSEYAKNTLRELHQQGLTFVFATGRHHVDVAGIREMTDIPAYMVTSNGARVHTPDNELLFSKNVPADLVQKMIDILKSEPDVFIHIYRNDSWLLSRVDEELRNYHNDSGFTFEEFDVDNAPTDGVSKVFFTHKFRNHELLANYEQKLNEQFAGLVTVAFSTPWCLEVMGPDISKGHALQVVAESLGKSLDDCIAFGDGMNDVEMLSMADKGLVMGTAHEKVFAALPEIERIGSSSDDAVPHYLREHLLK
ncbi:Cof-type HAD-IIB family hydrolase [Vibrio sp.]|uniref:Cof-type HAD-IIB family hydrolase n=1 Tax=Vibrio viridaestus TaxID=2487322 RepID=A0A3N9TBI9_9VIBR|nr:Cof-type HAD-IIB family hydrolase [Vibrio viridaestus]MDC0611228.1 Cof-type HAD-IIB family hydrolase [Vibrio sp.]RQW61491.1 Cof-type HAD-IIB family hydrolase [Vibrio viridaestus]